jgi:hypothetical protein
MNVIAAVTHRSRKGAGLFFTLMASMTLAGCGSLVDMGRTAKVDPRRLYLTDAAANDSLPGTIRTEGLLLVMQPGGKQYKVVNTGGDAADPLEFYVRNSGGGFNYQSAVTGTAANGDVTYTLVAPATKSVADYYLVFLRGQGNMPATPPMRVRLFPVDTSQSSNVSVRLHMVRRLQGLGTEAEKAQYAEAFHVELKSIFQAYGVTVDTSTAIVEPNDSALTVVYSGVMNDIPGTRLPGAVNMYLVNSIDGGRPGTMVVGFAPREAIDLSTDANSRVVLNVQGSAGGIPQRARSAAVTAAHEMGHFLGLRHTSATRDDRSYDNDESNRNDGFESQFCTTLEKRSAETHEITVKGPGGLDYCLRVSGTAFTCACPDVGNLMYPYKCETTQKTLGADQQKFMRNNLKVYQ